MSLQEAKECQAVFQGLMKQKKTQQMMLRRHRAAQRSRAH